MSTKEFKTIEDLTTKADSETLLEYLGLLKYKRVQAKNELEQAKQAYLKAAGANTSIETKETLHKEWNLWQERLDQVLDFIKQIERRLGAVDNQSTQNQTLQADAERIIETLKVQLTPSTTCVEPNDAVIKSLFQAAGGTVNVKEKRKTKKKPAIVSKITIKSEDNGFKLDEFDRAVLGVIISEYLYNNRFTTINIIHRALIGRPGQGLKGFYPRKNQEEAILHSVTKLMATVVDFSGVNDSLKKMNYTDKDGNQISLRMTNLLSANILDAKINGQEIDGVIFFKENSPLFKIAEVKDQVIRYPHELLNVPNQNNTPRVISLKKYVMRRICEIKLHKQLAHTITFDDIFNRCELTAADRFKKEDARKAVIKFLEHLKKQAFIADFKVLKRGNSVQAISVTF